MKKVRAEIIGLVEDLLEAQKAVPSDTSSDVDVHEKPNKLFGFLFIPDKLVPKEQQKLLKRKLISALRQTWVILISNCNRLQFKTIPGLFLFVK